MGFHCKNESVKIEEGVVVIKSGLKAKAFKPQINDTKSFPLDQD